MRSEDAKMITAVNQCDFRVPSTEQITPEIGSGRANESRILKKMKVGGKRYEAPSRGRSSPDTLGF